MIKNYLKTGFRNLKKNRVQSAINIIGLSIGIACSILILLFIRDELTFDSFNKNVDDIFIINANIAYSKTGKYTTTAKLHTGPTLKKLYPEVIDFVRMKKKELIIKHQDALIPQNIIFTDSSFLNVFSFPLKSGNSDMALNKPDSIIVSNKMVKKFFPNKEPLGSVLNIKIGEEFKDFIVTGVLMPSPENSSIKFDFLVNLNNIYKKELNTINSKEKAVTFLQLSGKEKVKSLSEKFKNSINKEIEHKGIKGSEYTLHPFSKYHFNAGLFSGIIEGQSKPAYSFILSLIGLLIVLIACFNFTNMTLGVTSGRLKEIGIRKVIGAGRKQVARQFLFESFLQCLISFLLGIILARLFLPVFNSFSRKFLSFSLFDNFMVPIILIGLCVFVSLISGGYPAIILSRFNSLYLFKGNLKFSGKNIVGRILIILQFSFSVILIVSTLFMYKQYNFMINKDLGFKSEQIIKINLNKLSPQDKKNNSFYEIFKLKLKQISGVKSVGATTCPLDTKGIAMGAKTLQGQPFLLGMEYVDYDYFKTLEMHIKEGRNFSREYPDDLKNSVIVNETFLKYLDVRAPLGKTLNKCLKLKDSSTIIGVLKDIDIGTLERATDPLIIKLGAGNSLSFNYMYIKIAGTEITRTLKAIKKEFKTLVPRVLLEYSFLDENMEQLYEQEKHWTKIITAASLFAILIACFGLFGLTLLIVEKRIKEIGIRKVLGASNLKITRLINKDFFLLIIIANIVAWPVSYYVMNKFLLKYAYRINLSLGIFVLTGLGSVLIALFTISINTFRIARSNPVNSLRCE